MVAQSLASLLQRASIDDHEEVLQSCNAVLAKSKSDLQAQHMKVVALLKLDRYDEALRTFEAGGDALKKSAGLEYAYASYKCGKLEQAAEAVTRTASAVVLTIWRHKWYGVLFSATGAPMLIYLLQR